MDGDAFNDDRFISAMRIGQQRFEELIQDAARAGNVPVRINRLRQSEVTRRNILQAIMNTYVDESTTLVVYYDGHGATDGTRGHYLAVMQGDPVLRSEILDACLVRRNRPMFLILFTDCCSSRIDIKRAGPLGVGINPDHDRVMRNLFLQHRGVVDVTAATYDPEDHSGQSGLTTLGFDFVPAGSLFTSAMCGVCNSLPSQELDPDGDGFASWAEFFPNIQRRTDEYYRHCNRNGHYEQEHQIPEAFCLGYRSDQQPSQLRYRMGIDIAEEAGRLRVMGVRNNTPATNIIELNGKDSPGAHFARGDVIERVNGQRVHSIAGLYSVLDGIPSKEPVRIQGPDAFNNGRPYSAIIRLEK